MYSDRNRIGDAFILRVMQQVFECLRCGHVSTLTPAPIHCRACGNGAGILRPTEPNDNGHLLQEPAIHPSRANPPEEPGNV